MACQGDKGEAIGLGGSDETCLDGLLIEGEETVRIVQVVGHDVSQCGRG
jgi:hypothetical protein